MLVDCTCLNVIPHSLWVHVAGGPMSGKSVCHLVLESDQREIITWSVAVNRKEKRITLPELDDDCWSWMGGVEDFFKQFRPFNT